MMYTIEGFMRPVGAQGITWHNVLRVEADSLKAAILKAYDTHEHLERVTVTPDGGEPVRMGDIA